MELTKEEKQAIKQLEEVAKNWPKSLWLFSASGTLHVMRKVNGKRVYRGEYISSEHSIGTINIENDGGDW